jgi:B12-binding domain/radical SAM domain protein of rhizo-twelve system
MKYAFVNPNWSFRGSTYFGCRDPHYPLELLFSVQKVEAAGHHALLVDAQTDNLSIEDVRNRVAGFDPDFLVIPSAPSYLFWRCPPPELRVPMEYFEALDSTATKVCIGPHASATPAAVLRKTGADVAIKGEPEQAIVELASTRWERIDGVCYRKDASFYISPNLAVVDMKSLSALDFRNYSVEAHSHRHHVFFGEGRGAELEFARGCPWNCTFCNKQLFRNKFRERPVETVLEEIDTVTARGVNYVYFIDEIFGVGKNVRVLLEAISRRNDTDRPLGRRVARSARSSALHFDGMRDRIDYRRGPRGAQQELPHDHGPHHRTADLCKRASADSVGAGQPDPHR